ncbi:MAG: HD domain-containing phosphohydrolase [Campylobacterales bacterium]
MKLPMFLKVNLSVRLFWIVATLVLSIATIETLVRYKQTKDLIESRATTRAKALHDYFISMRYVYQQQFLNSGLDVNDTTVGFLPAHASTLISEEFSKLSKQGITVRNVSDRPRNPKNKADSLEVEMIRYFIANPDQNESMKRIIQNGNEYFFFSAPLRIQPYCLFCHGEKDKTIGYIQTRYDSAYDYRVGDVRGLTSIKIPISGISDPMMAMFWSTTFFSYLVSIVLLGIVYAAIRKVTAREEQIKDELASQVKEKTLELQKAYLYEKHLASILRTVADVNQLLITSQHVDELIDKSAQTLATNESFMGVKILLEIKGELAVKASYGVLEDWSVTDIDQMVFDSNTSLMFTNFDNDSVPEHCRLRAKAYGLKAIYSVPLKSSNFAQAALGVLTVCTRMKEGFTDKERSMLDELAGDIGFAINSFVQKETIERLHIDKLNNYRGFIDALVDMIEQRDTYTAGHTKRVAQYAVMIAKEMGLTEGEIKTLAEAAKLHDIGKVVTPDSVLLKPGALTRLEYELIKEHVNAGYQVLSNVGSYDELADIIVHHHERFDGSGYPNGKRGDEIPLLGHILAVADSFDAMTTNRIYKPKMSVSKSLEELKILSGSLYHPDVVTAAVKVLEDVDIEQVEDQAIGGNEIDKERLSYFFKDRLTKLYNEDYLTLAINGRSGYPSPKSLTIVSISNFTRYNKEYTWEGGNSLLVGFAEFLTKQLGMCIVFRVWGDHFVIADCELDMALIMKDSPLAKAGVAYKIKTVKAPFENIKETLLRT